MSVRTEHLGVTIYYNEERNKWYSESPAFDGPSLKTVKGKIAKHDADARRVVDLPVILLGHWRGPKYGVATLVTDDKAHVWLDVIGEGRVKAKAADVAIDTPENRAKVKQAASHNEAAQREREAAGAALDSIPRITIEELLVREEAAGSEQEAA